MNAPTVVVFGGGCDFVYPAENYSLFQHVIDGGGAVISENEWGFPAMPYSFRERNRIIAGLARATLIVEAGLPSGTFSTADEALAASKEVLAVPGAITSKTSRGSNRLIYQGATPIVDAESFEDVLCSIYGCLKESQTIERALKQMGENNKRKLKGEIISESEKSTGSLMSVETSKNDECTDKRLESVVDALRARPTSIDEMCKIVKEQELTQEQEQEQEQEHKQNQTHENVLSWLLVQIDRMERDKDIVRLPDGRYVARIK